MVVGYLHLLYCLLVFLDCAESGILYGLLGLTGFACLFSCSYRSKLRAQYDLEEAPCVDCLVHFFCATCALCQEYRELKSRGFDMGIGNRFLVIKSIFHCFLNLYEYSCSFFFMLSNLKPHFKLKFHDICSKLYFWFPSYLELVKENQCFHFEDVTFCLVVMPKFAAVWPLKRHLP